MVVDSDLGASTLGGKSERVSGSVRYTGIVGAIDDYIERLMAGDVDNASVRTCTFIIQGEEALPDLAIVWDVGFQLFRSRAARIKSHVKYAANVTVWLVQRCKLIS